MLFLYICADIFHFSAVVALLWRILKRKSCAGISPRCQLLLAVAITTRCLYTFASESYSFLFYHFASKLFFITFSYVLMLLVQFAFQQSRKNEEDVSMTEPLVLLSFLMALFFNTGLTPLNVTWEFGSYLESLAMIPQYCMIFRQRRLDMNMFVYLTAMFMYQLFFNFSMVSLHCEKREVINASLGVIQMYMQGVIAVTAFVVLIFRKTTLFEIKRPITIREDGCPFTERCNGFCMINARARATSELARP